MQKKITSTHKILTKPDKIHTNTGTYFGPRKRRTSVSQARNRSINMFGNAKINQEVKSMPLSGPYNLIHEKNNKLK